MTIFFFFEMLNLYINKKNCLQYWNLSNATAVQLFNSFPAIFVSAGYETQGSWAGWRRFCFGWSCLATSLAEPASFKGCYAFDHCVLSTVNILIFEKPAEACMSKAYYNEETAWCSWRCFSQGLGRGRKHPIRSVQRV